MSDVQVGQILSEAQPRDAVHMALASVVADTKLMPGDHVGFARDSTERVHKTPSKKIGIVDPFLMVPVYAGERFWVFLYPRTVTNLRHQWSHPDFPEEQAVLRADGASVVWLQNLADEIGMSYDRLLNSIASGTISTGDQEMYGCRDEDDIRRHYSAVVGRPAPDNIHFSCAC